MAGNLDSVWENARIVPIYRPCGKFADGSTKYVRAGCQQVFFNGTMYLMPVPLGTGTLQSEKTNSAYASIVDSHWFQSANGMGWIDLNYTVVMDDHEFGDPAGHPDDWEGVHRFALI